MKYHRPYDKVLPNDLTPGTVIAIRYSMYKHFAIVSDQCSEINDSELPNLISLSYRTGTVQEEPWHVVVGDKLVEKSLISGTNSLHDVLARARECIQLGIKYELLTFNCEHFVRYAHGLPIESIQVKKTFYGAAVGAASCLLLPNVTVIRFVLLAATGAATSLKRSLDRI